VRGTDIPIGARIFAVADALDAITSDRPYRKAAQLRRSARRDSALLRNAVRSRRRRVFLTVPNELWLELRSEITGRNKQFSTFDIAHVPSAS
jgi:hypothetical protein